MHLHEAWISSEQSSFDGDWIVPVFKKLNLRNKYFLPISEIKTHLKEYFMNKFPIILDILIVPDHSSLLL